MRGEADNFGFLRARDFLRSMELTKSSNSPLRFSIISHSILPYHEIETFSNQNLSAAPLTRHPGALLPRTPPIFDPGYPTLQTESHFETLGKETSP